VTRRAGKRHSQEDAGDGGSPRAQRIPIGDAARPALDAALRGARDDGLRASLPHAATPADRGPM